MSNTDSSLVIKDEDDLMLTTIDNPFNPKTEYDKWRTWDTDNGYNTEEFLARLTDVPNDIDIDDDIVVNQLTNQAIQTILEHDILNVYKLV